MILVRKIHIVVLVLAILIPMTLTTSMANASPCPNMANMTMVMNGQDQANMPCHDAANMNKSCLDKCASDACHSSTNNVLTNTTSVGIHLKEQRITYFSMIQNKSFSVSNVIQRPPISIL